jgi:C1A family cysteine protease
MYPLYSKAQSSQTGMTFGTGWLPPLPDMRDYTAETPAIAEMTMKMGVTPDVKEKMKVKAKVNLREFCSPVENQGSLGSCTAHAAVGVVEYFQRRAHDKYIDGSRLFVYKITRNLLGVTGDTGAYLRNTIGALVLCGVPDENYWPYTEKDPDFDKEPTPFVYAVADNYKTVKYFCHDPLGKDVAPEKVLRSVKSHLSAGIPSMFGFFGFPSFDASQSPGEIPFPGPSERAKWGHAVVAVGYDDEKVIANTQSDSTTTGALLIRNSWGEGWGEGGYGWLPYEYVRKKLAVDFWSLLSMDWVDTEQFQLD